MTKNKNGFTLLEALLAAVVLAIVLFGSALFMYSNQKNVAGADVQRLATWSAIAELETLKATLYANIVNGNDKVQLGKTTATRTWTVTDSSGPAAYKQVTVLVSWPEGNNTGSVSLVTYIAQP